MSTHENIKFLREKLGLSQEDLATRVGYKDRSSIAKVESGLVDLAESKIAAFASALSVTPAQLMGLDEPEAIAVNTMLLARNIRFLRRKSNLTQEDIAKKFGYKNYTTVQKWESGISEPPLKVVHALAELFGVEINALTQCDLENGETPPHDILDEVDVAFYGDYKELTDNDKETVRDMVRIMRQRKEKRSK